jgi:hypothetical protein
MDSAPPATFHPIGRVENSMPFGTKTDELKAVEWGQAFLGPYQVLRPLWEGERGGRAGRPRLRRASTA